jgi:putative tricarboxylic transport membrane protein
MAELLRIFAELTQLVTLDALIALLIGLTLGILIGVLPGMGPLLGVVLVIPFTFYMPPVPSMALLLGIYQGGSYGGAVTATILGIPGTPMAAATLLDAYPMARLGRASEAVTLATLASAVGGTLSAFALILTAPALAAIAMRFGPAEIFALALLGLTCIGTLSQGAPLKGLLAGLFGLSVACVGNDPITGFQRFTFGITQLEGGFTFVALLVGLFAISELLMQIERPARAFQSSERVGMALATFRTLWTRPLAYLRSSLVGIVIGIIPGIGGVTSSFLSYKLAKDFSRTPERFGKGEPDGVIASEAANSATTGGAMIPMLAIGIPGDPIVAVLMGGLMIQGLTPGPMMFLANQDVVLGIFAAFLVGAVLLLPLGLALLPLFVRVLKIPQSVLLAAVLLLSILGTYALQRQMADLWIMWLFGLIGWLMRKGGFPLAPFVIGVVLGPIFEANLRRTTIMVGGDFWGFLLGRPIALAVLALSLAALLVPLIQAWRAGPQSNQPPPTPV